MAVKSWYLTIVETGTNKKVFDKLFFTAPLLNKYMKEEKILEKYPKPQYYIVKENY